MTMTIRELIAKLEQAVEDHAQGWVDQPATLDSEVIFQDSDLEELTVSYIESAGGNAYAPAIIIKLS